ncbi:TetR family transcriptional regulator [soil metagenome]
MAGDQAGASRRETVRGRRQVRRVELLDAAMDVIRRHGPQATMEDLAAAGGISKPILYRHFHDRDGLVAAITECVLAELGVILAERLGEATLAGSRSGVRATIDSFFEYIEREPELYRFVVQTDNRRGQMTALVFTQQVARLVADAVRVGLTQTGRDAGPAEIWSRAIVGMVETVGTWWVDEASVTVPRPEAVDRLADLIWWGLADRSPAGHSPVGGVD